MIEDKHFPIFYGFMDRSKIKRVEKSWAFHHKIKSSIINIFFCWLIVYSAIDNISTKNHVIIVNRDK